MEDNNTKKLISHAIEEYFSTKNSREPFNSIGHLNTHLDRTKDEIRKLHTTIDKYSKSSSKHANAIKCLTAGLVFIGLLQFSLTAYLEYKEYQDFKGVLISPKQTIIKQAP